MTGRGNITVPGHDVPQGPGDAAVGASHGHKRNISDSIMSKLSFLRASSDESHVQPENASSASDHVHAQQALSARKEGKAMSIAVHQQKTRRRKGSLRKAALLGRGAQREKRELETSPLITTSSTTHRGEALLSPTSPDDVLQSDAYGLGIITTTQPAVVDKSANSSASGHLLPLETNVTPTVEAIVTSPNSVTSPTQAYISTTDEDDILSIVTHLPLRNGRPLSLESDGYYSGRSGSLARRRSTLKPKSPLSVPGLAVNTLPVPDADWDYSETEWWGWLVLIVTWIVFVIGMGSCLGVWSWAWDVGETPYAPPELEDDPTLPIVGYYPALIILTGVMAWVWVVVAWVGMKYFRHAKITGD